MPPGMSAHAVRREKYLREQRAKAKRDVANLEKRWLIADAKVAERRQADAEAAHRRVMAWEGKRATGQKVMDSAHGKRSERHSAALRTKEEKTEAWRQRTEAEEARRREEHAAQRLAAGKRFASGLRMRDFRLQQAEERMAQRAGAMAALRRAELDERARQAEVKASSALAARQRADDELRDRSMQIDQRGKAKAAQVEDFLRKKREEHEPEA